MTDISIDGISDTLVRSLGSLRSSAGEFASQLAEANKSMESMDKNSQKLSRSLSSSLRSAFDKAIFGGERLGDVFRDLASSVADKAFNAAITPVTNALSNSLTGIVGGLGSGLVSALGFANGGAFSGGRVRAFAQGGAFSAGDVTPFAQGGVVAGPTLFGMRNGLGLMGEAGPEAVMPLTRGPDGKLGVQARGAGGSGSPVVINISTPDVAGFQRSRGQISAQLARAVQRGQGGL